jgi:hypothetical protein
MTLSIKPFKIGMRVQARVSDTSLKVKRYWNSILFTLEWQFYSHRLNFYLFGSRWGLWDDRRRVRLLFSRFRTLRCCDIPRTLLLLVLGGIGWFDAYYNRYFGILLIAPFVFNEGHCNPLCIKLLCKAAALCVYNKLVEQITRSRDSAQCCRSLLFRKTYTLTNSFTWTHTLYVSSRIVFTSTVLLLLLSR